MRQLKGIQPHFQNLIDEVILDLLDSYVDIEDIDITDIKGCVTDTNTGRAYFEGGLFTVPIWAYTKRNKDYFTYYVAHELAHQIKYQKYDTEGSHDYRFYEIFVKLCPKKLQHFELHYKPSSKKYGIK